MNLRSLFIPLLCTALGAAAPAASATPITYVIHETVGGATADGAILTDGTIGILSAANILSYAFLLSDGNTSNTVTNTGGNVLLSGPNLGATATGLYFDFSTAGAAGFGVIDAYASTYLCFVSAGATCGGTTGSIQIGVYGSSSASGVLTTVQQIGTAIASTPEPTTLLLVGTGAIGVIGVWRRRQAKPA